jgi:hypothetical protein
MSSARRPPAWVEGPSAIRAGDWTKIPLSTTNGIVQTLKTDIITLDEIHNLSIRKLVIVSSEHASKRHVATIGAADTFHGGWSGLAQLNR